MEHMRHKEVLRNIETKSEAILRMKNKVEISGIHEEKRGLGRFDTHRIYGRQEEP